MQDSVEHDRLYSEASELVYPLIEIHDRQLAELNAAARANLERGMALLGQVLRINPQNWPAMWLLGKCHQRLQEHEAAFDMFAAAHEINGDHPDVAREASIAAMQIRRPREAIRFCERAIKANPADAGLVANLALALLFSGAPARALSVANASLARSPNDEITARIAAVCQEVCNGTRPCPLHVSDLE